MTGIVDWAGERARMIIAFIMMSVVIGAFAYTGLPKEGEPDIEIPILVISVPFPGISAEDSEKLLVKPMEAKLQDLDGLKSMQGTAAENYANIVMEFEFGWDKTQILADVRDKMGQAEGEFPTGFEQYSLEEVNFSEFPILIVSLSGDLPERTLLRVTKDLRHRARLLRGQNPLQLQRPPRRLRPAHQGQWRPRRDFGRADGYPPHIRGPGRHRAL